MFHVVVSLGSNIDAQKNCQAGVAALSREFSVLLCSPIVQTAPLGVVDQPDFLNGVVYLQTALNREDFNLRLKALEVSLGRQPRSEKCGPREIDLDVLIWDGCVVNEDYFEREFLRQSVAVILPDFSVQSC